MAWRSSRVPIGIAAATVILLAALVAAAFVLFPAAPCGNAAGNTCAVADHAKQNQHPAQSNRVVAPVAVATPGLPSKTAAQSAPASASGSNLVANTFQTLHASPDGPALGPSTTDASSSLSEALRGPTTRTVSTVVIHADAKSDAIDPALGAIEPALAPVPAGAPQPTITIAKAVPAPAATSTAAVDPTVAPASSTPVPLAPLPLAPRHQAAAAVQAPPPASLTEPAKTPARAPAPVVAAKSASAPPTGSQTPMRVVGSGVTVRSGPSTADKALFNLPPGEQVSVVDNHRGWLHITDGKGRSGWLYSAYVAPISAK